MRRLSLAGALIAAPVAAAAQAPDDRVTVELFSDLVERGLSVSGGRAAARVRTGGEVARGLRIDASVATLRGARRNLGADAGIDLAASYRATSGALALDAGVAGRLFAGANGRADYVEAFGGGSVLIGPAEIGLTAAYAPDQSAIGGDNLYLRARGRAALIGTPFTLIAHVGRSSGDADDALASARLRPGGTYHDWSAGAEYSRGPVTVGLSYTDSDLAGDRAPTRALARHGGARLVAQAALRF